MLQLHQKRPLICCYYVDSQASSQDCTVIGCSALAASINQSLASADSPTVISITSPPQHAKPDVWPQLQAATAFQPPPAQLCYPGHLQVPLYHHTTPHYNTTTTPAADYPATEHLRNLKQQQSKLQAVLAQAQQGVSVLEWHVRAAEGTAADKLTRLHDLRRQCSESQAAGQRSTGLPRQIQEVRQESDAAHEQVLLLQQQLRGAEAEVARYQFSAQRLLQDINHYQQLQYCEQQEQQQQQLDNSLDLRRSQANMAALLQQRSLLEQQLQQESLRNRALQEAIQQQQRQSHGSMRLAVSLDMSAAASPSAAPNVTATQQDEPIDAVSLDVPAPSLLPALPADALQGPATLNTVDQVSSTAVPACAQAATEAASLSHQAGELDSPRKRLQPKQQGASCDVMAEDARASAASSADDLASSMCADQAPAELQTDPSATADIDVGSRRAVAFFISSDSYGFSEAVLSRQPSMPATRSRRISSHGSGSSPLAQRVSSSSKAKPRSRSSSSRKPAPAKVVTPLLAALAERPAAAGAPSGLLKSVPRSKATHRNSSSSSNLAPHATVRQAVHAVNRSSSASRPRQIVDMSRPSSLPLRSVLARPSSYAGGSSSCQTMPCPSNTGSRRNGAAASSHGGAKLAGRSGNGNSNSRSSHRSSSSSDTAKAVATAVMAAPVALSRREAMHALSVMGWGGPNRTRRQPGDLALHVAKLGATYDQMMAEWTALKNCPNNQGRRPSAVSSSVW